MKVVTNEEFYCQTKRNRESWREREHREREKIVASYREKEGDK